MGRAARRQTAPGRPQTWAGHQRGPVRALPGPCDRFSRSWRQLDDLYGEEALDVSAEIKVMEQMLAQEGLGGMTLGGP